MPVAHGNSWFHLNHLSDGSACLMLLQVIDVFILVLHNEASPALSVLSCQ